MLIRIYRLDENSQKTLLAELHVDALRLMLVAEDREENTRRRGRVWAAGAVPFFAQELLKTIQHASRASARICRRPTSPCQRGCTTRFTLA
ncbi:hypothetical protein ASF61_21485 [Duganella sp. Leaf126]|uniref:hypothetical protein n=1 Tax=Duganella sp. Leaf126 TaxID=1736266 RepID=UPI0006F59697|nr:hypothetical protein [Duganella sp. Leaf126]KQQ44704.1 hypothetical protein ASF61_21485 [Duganella sp. Leaf126]